MNEGDYVLSRDELTGQVSAKQITHKFVEQHDDDMRELTVSNDLIKTVIITSDEHPFYVFSKGFTAASELKTNYQLVSLDYQILKVVSNKRIEQSMPMYNFEVADYHTYAVSEQNVWVHNDCLFGKNFPKKVRKHIDQVRKRYDGQIDDIPAPGKGGIEKIQEIIKNRVSQGNGYRSTYAGEPADFYPEQSSLCCKRKR